MVELFEQKHTNITVKYHWGSLGEQLLLSSGNVELFSGTVLVAIRKDTVLLHVAKTIMWLELDLFKLGRKWCKKENVAVKITQKILGKMHVFVFQEVVKHAVLCNEIPRAQAHLRRRSCPEQKLEELRRTGLRLAFTCLTHRDLDQATTLLTNMVQTSGRSFQKGPLHHIYYGISVPSMTWNHYSWSLIIQLFSFVAKKQTKIITDDTRQLYWTPEHSGFVKHTSNNLMAYHFFRSSTWKKLWIY